MFCRFLIDHGQTWVGFLPVSTFDITTDVVDRDAILKQSEFYLSAAVPFTDEVHSTRSKNFRDVTRKGLYEATHKIRGFLKDDARREFQLSNCGNPWAFNLTINLYGCKTSEGERKDMDCVKHVGTLYSSFRCLECNQDSNTIARGATRCEPNKCNL